MIVLVSVCSEIEAFFKGTVISIPATIANMRRFPEFPTDVRNKVTAVGITQIAATAQ
jgi:hypothetical protein